MAGSRAPIFCYDRPLMADVVEKVGVELFARFSRVALPSTYASERLIGRSERSIFLPVLGQHGAATFSTASAGLCPSAIGGANPQNILIIARTFRSRRSSTRIAFWRRTN